MSSISAAQMKSVMKSFFYFYSFWNRHDDDSIKSDFKKKPVDLFSL
jgi:hypothetical protein